MTVVLNCKNTTNSKLPRGYSSWITAYNDRRKWDNRETIHKCCNCGTRKEDMQLDGAHVRVKGATCVQYIVPLCNTCNTKKDGEYTINADLMYRMVKDLRDEAFLQKKRR